MKPSINVALALCGLARTSLAFVVGDVILPGMADLVEELQPRNAAAAVQVAPRAAATPTASCTSSVDAVLPPSEDPWYTAPKNFEWEAPGTVLRVREAKGNLTALAGVNCTAAYNILYRTTDSLYRPAWAVTTVFVPNNTDAQALLSYQIPYDSAYINSSPSYAIYSQLSLTTVYVDVILSLNKGWFVNVPDYEGPLAAFTAGVLSGHATIDSIRAVLNWGSHFGLNRTAVRYAMSGYSGGALASEWAAELQVQYAPEMTFAGAALGGLTPNVTSVLEITNNGYAAGLIPNGIFGLTAQHPDIREYLITQLNPTGPYNASSFLAALNYTLSQSSTVFAFKDMSKYFINGFDFLANKTILGKITYPDGTMGYHGVPQMPVFAYKAIADGQSPVRDTDALVAKYCEVGANILYHRNSIGGHSAEFINGHSAASDWLDSVLAGTYAKLYNPVGCTILNVTVNISSSAQ